MKKLALGLLLALGVANVSAAKLETRIEPTVKKNGAAAWVKNHKALTAAVATVMLAGSVYVVAKKFLAVAAQEATPALGNGEEGPSRPAVEANWAQKYIVNNYEKAGSTVKEYGYDKPLKLAKEYPKTAIAGGAALALTVAAILDLTRGEKSAIKSLVAKLSGKKASQVADAEVVA